MGGFARWFLQRDMMSVWDLLGLKDIFEVLDQLYILSRSAEREDATPCLRGMTNYMAEGGIISKEIGRERK